MNLAALLNALEIAPNPIDGEVECRLPPGVMRGYVRGIRQASGAAQTRADWRLDVFSVVLNFAIHALPFASRGLIIGLSPQARAGAVLGNPGKALEYEDATLNLRVGDLIATHSRHRSFGLVAFHNCPRRARLAGRDRSIDQPSTLIFDGPLRHVDAMMKEVEEPFDLRRSSSLIRSFNVAAEDWAVGIHQSGEV